MKKTQQILYHFSWLGLRDGNITFSDELDIEPAKMLRVDSLDDSTITAKFVCKTAPIRQWEVKSEILRRIKKAFDAEGIEIPFPQRVIHTRTE